MTGTIFKTKIRRIFLGVFLFLEIISKEKETFQILSLEILEVKISMSICGFHSPPLSRVSWSSLFLYEPSFV